MRAIFNQELKQLGSDLESMANQVATAIERAAESLRQGDIVIAEQVIDAEAAVERAGCDPLRDRIEQVKTVVSEGRDEPAILGLAQEMGVDLDEQQERALRTQHRRHAP